MNEFITTPVNLNASDEAINLMEYLAGIAGKKIITGQHTQTRRQEELTYIENITGKLPAICGFELLSYSPNINYDHADEPCLKEVNENKGTLEEAMEWALDKKGILTFTWHWFSPLGGQNKSFYTEHTDFDVEKAIIVGTEENKALISDMDEMAMLLKPFQDKHIPILWRPFHESEGTWFWWGSKGPKFAKELFRIMYQRYTYYHQLNNLIWVWNSPVVEGYPGDDVVDIISVDLYLTKHAHGDYRDEYEELIKITSQKRLAALGEIGVLPDIDLLSQSKIPWSWYMTWSGEFCIGEEWNSTKVLKEIYQSDYAITLDKLDFNR